MKSTKLSRYIAASLLIPASAMAAESAELEDLKRRIEVMKQDHEIQIRALERRIGRAEARDGETDGAVNEEKAEIGASAAQNATPRTRSGENSFNPAISLVLQGGYAGYSQDPEEFRLEGMPLGGEAGLHQEGLALWETELTASANIDNRFFGQATLGLHNHEGEIEVDVEEAFVDTLALPAGLGLRFGRFYSAIGYLNEHHTHAWDFADAPLAYQAFLGSQYKDDGLRLSWLAPTDTLFVEFGAEALRGDQYPGGGNSSGFGAAHNVFAKVSGDIGSDTSWQLGVSRLEFEVEDRVAGGHAHDHEGEDAAAAFSGDSELTVFDAVMKKDLGGDRSLILQGEYISRDEEGEVTLSEDAGDALFAYDGAQDGWYLQGVFQFNRRWRAGLRYDHLNADNGLSMIDNTTGEANEVILEESGFQASDHDPDRWSVMVDWSPSEFSRLRLQYARDDSRGEMDEQVFLQYVMTLGAHGAHRY